MKKIIYIDPLSNDGHLNFNRIYISKLLEENINIDIVVKEDYNLDIKLPLGSAKYNIPNCYYSKNRGGLFNRYNYYKILRFIKQKINLKDYDYVIMAGYEEISFFFSNIKNIILINHNNISGLNNPIKQLFFKLISKTNTHIVFEQYMKDYLYTLGISNVIVIPHGLPLPIDESAICNESELTFLFDGINLNKFKYIIFSPSGTSVDTDFLNHLVQSTQFNNFIQENQILLILKGNIDTTDNCNIYSTNKYLSEYQYHYLFRISDTILITYPSTHRNRVSAVFFECVANNKICFMSDILTFRSNANHIKFPFFFSSINELIKCIEVYIKLENKTQLIPYKNTENMVPTFKNL